MILRAIVEPPETTRGLEIPEGLVNELGGGKRPNVTLTLNGYTWKCRVATVRGRSLIGLSNAHRRAAGVKIGGDIEVTMLFTPRGVTRMSSCRCPLRLSVGSPERLSGFAPKSGISQRRRETKTLVPRRPNQLLRWRDRVEVSGRRRETENVVKLSTVPVEVPSGLNVIVGQSHFIKTVEDIHEVLVGAGPHVEFGLAFCEASGPCLIRTSGNADDLIEIAARNAESIGAGHCFIVYLRNAFPVNVLNAIKQVPEVCSIFCATANPLEILVAQTDLGRGILGVVDGMPPTGIETTDDQNVRRSFLRTIGYKL